MSKLYSSLKRVAVVGAIVASAFAGWGIRSAVALGPPATRALIYRGTLEEDGRLVMGNRDVAVRLFTAQTGGTRLCETPAAGVTVSNGSFEVTLDESCTAAVSANPETWIEVLVGGAPLGRSRVGATPYAIEARNAVNAHNATGALEARLAAIEATVAVDPPCPPGYARDATVPNYTVCARTVTLGSAMLRDEVVKVGTGRSAFWIDRYEASVYDVDTGVINAEDPLPGLSLSGQRANRGRTSYRALSRSGVTPRVSITWFQANEVCRASDKRLATGDEWLAAAQGTADPATASNGAMGTCLTASMPMPSSIRLSGAGSSCESVWGAQDMIGNVNEWTNDWFAGVGDATRSTPDNPTMPTSGWVDSAYGRDGTGNVVSSASAAPDGLPRFGVPSAALRGGASGDGTRAGIFYIELGLSPANRYRNIGFRCVVPR